jgi:hypothetical protein
LHKFDSSGHHTKTEVATTQKRSTYRNFPRTVPLVRAPRRRSQRVSRMEHIEASEIFA